LGAANDNLPTFVIPTAAEVGGQNWSSGFLPAATGHALPREGALILDLAPPSTIGGEQQRGRDLPKAQFHHGDGKPEDTEL
jgi:hypothetical protein